MPDTNHLLGYYPDSVDIIYDTMMKGAFNCDVPNTFEPFNIYKSYALDVRSYARSYTVLMFRKYVKSLFIRATRVIFSAGARLSVTH